MTKSRTLIKTNGENEKPGKDRSGAVTPSEYESQVQLKIDNQVHLRPYQTSLCEEKLAEVIEKNERV